MTKSKLTYKSSGVDIEAGYEVVKRIKQKVRATFSADVLTNIGGFGGLYSGAFPGMKSPVLVSGCDGVGTKLKLAFETGIHNTIGIDCVAMSVNDILACGAHPLFFLDYIACHKADPKVIEQIVDGVITGCKQGQCALIGGETAEMNDLYQRGEYDIAGFAVGVVDKKDIIDGSKIKAGDLLIGLHSSGIHSNGYSLVRRIAQKAKWNMTKKKALLTPTKIYTKEIHTLMKKVKINGLAHITGGSFPEKLARILPKGLDALIDRASWQVPQVFRDLQNAGAIDTEEMYKTFNMGIGFVAVIKRKDVEKLSNPLIIGVIVDGSQKVRFIH